MKSYDLAEALSSLLSILANSDNVITDFPSCLLLAQRILSILALLAHYFQMLYLRGLQPFFVHFLGVIAYITVQIAPYSGIFSILGNEVLSMEFAFQDFLALQLSEHVQELIGFVSVDQELLHLHSYFALLFTGVSTHSVLLHRLHQAFLDLMLPIYQFLNLLQHHLLSFHSSRLLLVFSTKVDRDSDICLISFRLQRDIQRIPDEFGRANFSTLGEEFYLALISKACLIILFIWKLVVAAHIHSQFTSTTVDAYDGWLTPHEDVDNHELLYVLFDWK